MMKKLADCVAPQSPGINDPSSYSLLVADDDSITRLVIQKMLQQAGYQVQLVGDGKEAISALETGHYDLVLMDCNMPHLDGLAATAYIRNDSSGKIDRKIPVIALTGITSEDDQLRCLEAGMDACILKPVSSQTLIITIERQLGISSESPALQQSELPEKQVWDDAVFLDTLIANFLSEVPQLVDELERAIKCGDLRELQSLGHRLRGASAILSASTLSTRSKALELAGKAGDLNLASELAADLIRELHKLMEALEE